MIRRERKPPFTIILVAVLLILLPLLAYLQYDWQGSVSERLREQMQETMKRAATQFGEDFDHAIMGVFAGFQPGAFTSEKPEERDRQLRKGYAALYSEWNRTALYPKLVRDVYLVPRLNDPAQRLEHLNAASGEFENVEWPADLLAVRKSSMVSTVRLGAIEQLIQYPSSSVEPGIPAVIISVAGTLPIPPGIHFDLPIPAPVAEVIVKLDLDFIRKEFIPALAKQYVSNSDGTLTYNIAVVDRGAPQRVIYSSSGTASAADLKGDITTDIFSTNRMDYRRIVSPANSEFAVNRDVLEKRRVSRGFVSIQVQQNMSQGPFRLFAKGPNANSWQLVLTHQSGSLDKAVAQARNKNLAISFGILLLLAVSVALILVSSQRERRLAQQQMEFVSAVSHELRTPLAVICSAAENLADGVVRDAEQTRQYGTLVRNEGRRLTEMVEQVLDFAGIQSGKKTYRLEATEVSNIIDRALETFEMQIRDTGVVLEKRIAADLPMIFADRHALVRALQNLIGNALKYGGSGRFLAVRAESDAENVMISVEDRGEGISAKDLPHIFEPFYRGSSVVDAQIKGSGLGLALVKQIVKAHNAKITVDSQPSGAAFRIVLPRHAATSNFVASNDEAYSSR